MAMIHKATPIRFDRNQSAAFDRVLRERVRAYTRSLPNGSKANGFMWFKVAFFVATYWGLWASLALFEHSLPVTIGLIVIFSSVNMALAYNVSHDAVHEALSRNKWVNELFFSLTFTPMGPNGYLWRFRHKVMHHNCVNIPGFDFNIEALDILRFAPTQTWRPIHRFQHLYAPVLYCVFTAHWVFIKDFKMLTMTEIGNLKDIEHPWWRWAEVIAWKVVYIGYMLVLPAMVLSYSWWQVLLGYALFQAVVSIQFVITFVGSHLNEGIVFVESEGERMPHSFFEHQLRTSLDFHPTNPLVSFWFGGFNAHVAHHLFPNICSAHYPAITRIIQRTCAEYGMPYGQVSLVRLTINHFRFLRTMGREPEHAWQTYMYRPPWQQLAPAAK